MVRVLQRFGTLKVHFTHCISKTNCSKRTLFGQVHCAKIHSMQTSPLNATLHGQKQLTSYKFLFTPFENPYTAYLLQDKPALWSRPHMMGAPFYSHGLVFCTSRVCTGDKQPF